jgi:hypothetical protein
MIEHDKVDGNIDIVVSGTRDSNQVLSCRYALYIIYDKVTLVASENFVRDFE